MYKKIMYGLLLILTAIVIFYLFFTYSEKHENALYSRSEWPTTQGTVISSTSYIEFPSDDNLNVTVEFVYTISGTQYSCKQTWCAGETDLFSDTSKEVQEALWKYTPGVTVPVYYNPIDPKEAVVETNVLDAGWENFAFGIGFIAGMISFVLGIIWFCKGVLSCIVWVRLRKR